MSTHRQWLRENITTAMKILKNDRANIPEPCAFVLGYLFGAAEFTRDERAEMWPDLQPRSRDGAQK